MSAWVDFNNLRYVCFVALAIVTGSLSVFAQSTKDKRSVAEVTSVLAVSFVFAVFGAKLFHVLFEAKGHVLPDGSIANSVWELLKHDPWHWARYLAPGYVFYGGAIFAALGATLYLKKSKVRNALDYADYAAFSVSVGLVIGRLGCFFGGCCFGKPAHNIYWSVHYVNTGLAQFGPIHPTQLYEAAFCLFLAWASLRFKESFQAKGELFLWVVAGYALSRFIVEFYRGDLGRGFWVMGLSTSQLVSAGLIIAVVPILWHLRRRSSLDNRLQV